MERCFYLLKRERLLFDSIGRGSLAAIYLNGQINYTQDTGV